MTVLVGVLAKNGVVIGADSATTFADGSNLRTIEQPSQKARVVGDRVILAGTGQVGLGQRFHAVVDDQYSNKRLFSNQNTAINVGKALSASTIADFASTQAVKGQFGALVGFALGKKFHLCEFAIADFQPELKTDNLWYVSMGSGQMIADPFLGFIRKTFWTDGQPNLEAAIFAVTWSLQQVIDLNPGGVNGPIQLAVVRENAKGEVVSELLSEEEMSEHINNVRGIEEHLRKYRQQAEGELEVPSIPEFAKVGNG